MTEHFEYVMIGSGVAAVTVARHLLASGASGSILILEAGPRVERADRRGWWNYVLTERKPYDYCYDVEGENETVGDIKWGYDGARIMGYGGSTGHWGAWCLRYKPEDFHLKSNTGEGGDWPIGYDDLHPYYEQAEHYLSVCGDPNESWNANRKDQPFPRPDFGQTEADGMMLEAFVKCGIEPGKMPMARFRKCMTTGTCKYCPVNARFTAHDVLDELVRDPRYQGKVTVRCLSPVTRLATDGKRRIGAVDYLDLATGDEKRVTADRFILAAGTYESAKLLMASQSSEHPAGVGNGRDLVGRFIVSHSFLRVRGTIPTNPNRWVQELDFPTLMSRSFDTPEQQEDGKIFLFKNRALPNTDIANLMIAGKTRDEIRAVLSGPMTFELQAFYEEKGQYANRLTALSGKNRFGLPLTRIEFLRHPKFHERTQKQLGLMRPVLEAMDARNIGTFVDDPGGHHATSTCRMGKDESEGVTDSDMKVFGIDNLWVCSNAAFPNCAAVNPTLTLTAMAMRLGDHLSGSPYHGSKKTMKQASERVPA